MPNQLFKIKYFITFISKRQIVNNGASQCLQMTEKAEMDRMLRRALYLIVAKSQKCKQIFDPESVGTLTNEVTSSLYSHA